MTIDQKIDQVLEPAANVAESVVFWSMPIGGGKAIPLVLIILGTTALFLTIYFRFINFSFIIEPNIGNLLTVIANVPPQE